MTRAGVFGAFALAFALQAGAAEQALVDYSLKDQFGATHSRDDVRGKVVLLIGSDGDGSEFNAAWSRALNEAVAGHARLDALVELAHADLRGVPFFARGYVRKLMPEDPAEPVLLDWRGRLAKAYDYESGQTNVVVFGPNGELLAQASGTEPDEAQLDALILALVAALDGL